ncbi:flagellar M-ring protein FliF [bacterium]|nr:flagellar M-ring protein FliF [bacterium]
MNDFIKQLQQDIIRIWTGLTRIQRIIFGAVAAASVVAIVMLVLWAQTPEWSPLFTNMDEQDAGQVIGKLKEAKVPYQVSGTAIMVPKSKVHELRLEMAAKGLPQGGTVGFELFDKSQFGMTDALQKLNYQRALQGELVRTIQSLDGIESARVHLVIPEKDLFSDSAEDPSAAVVVKLKSGAKLKVEQVKTVTHLVAKSVEGLKEANVVITDVDGRNYSDEAGFGREDSLASPELTLSQMEVKKQVEGGLRKNLQATLDRVLGPNNSVVTVAADLDFSQVETNEETYQPVVRNQDGTQTGILRSTKELHESYNGQGGPNGGVPGVTSNINGGANASLPTYPASESAGVPGAYNKSDVVRNFEVNKNVTRKIKAPAEIKRLSVAVAVNGELDPQQLADLKQMVSAAAGSDVARGDTIVVTAQKFNDTRQKAEEEALAKAQQQETVQGYLKILAGVLIGIVALFLLRRGLAARAETFDDTPLNLDGFDVDGRLGQPVSIGTIGEDDRKTHLQKEITKVVKQQPSDVAKLLKSWMLEDE